MPSRARWKSLTGSCILVAWLVALAAPTVVGASSRVSADGLPPRLTIERLYSLPRLIGTAPGGFAWSADGRHLAFLWNDEGLNFRDVWVVEVEDPELRPERVTWMPHGEHEAGPNAVAIAQARERRERDPGVIAVAWHPDGQRLLTTFHADLWQVAVGSDPRRLTETEEVEVGAAYSPDGETIAFLREGELWTRPATVGLSDALAVQRTKMSRSGVRVEDFRWSPDGSQVALLEIDQRAIRVRGIPDYLTEETELVERRRAYPGEDALRFRVGVLDVDSGRKGGVQWIEYPDGAPDQLLSYTWSPDGTRLALDTSDLYAKDRRIYVADVAQVEPVKAQLIVREQDALNETFYFWRIAWSTDSQRVYFLSDRDEDYHVYAVEPARPAEVQRLTRGAWAVAEIYPVAGGLIVVGNRDKAEQRQLFRIDDGGGEPEKLSQRSGTHMPTISPDGRHAAVAFSSDGTPPDLLLTTFGKTPTERRVTRSPLIEFSRYHWVRPEYVAFVSHVDGVTLHGRLTLPPDFDPGRTYPAILGSVYTDSVRNQWGGRTAHPTWGLDQYLAQEGYVLLNVDMRGSWGRGREHRRGIRLDYGGMDVEDLESAVRFLATLGYVDMDRVGIWGSSYGGLMTVMSLFRKPGLYAAGVAGAPATNVWHALTGQMAVMMRPQDQPEEYADSSPFLHADGLEDPLMIIHGMRDQVVLFKDSVTLVQRLIQLGKDVDFVVLPDAGHGWDNEGLGQTRFAFEKLIQHFDRHLGSGLAAAAE
jgi:dipeptidyl-peptidase-4